MHLGRKPLTAAGHRHDQVSNYAALPGMECRHNLNYWRRGTFLGLGPGAHSFDGEARWWNVEDTNAYVRMLGDGIPRWPNATNSPGRRPPRGGDARPAHIGRARPGAISNRTRAGPSGRVRTSHKGGDDRGTLGPHGLTPDALMLMNPVTVRLFVALGL